jgi:hypothetical protein
MKLAVVLGDLSVSSQEGTEQTIKGKAVAYPSYPSTTVANDPYDIGLIRLNSAAALNDNVKITSTFSGPVDGTVSRLSISQLYTVPLPNNYLHTIRGYGFVISCPTTS